LFSNKFLAPLLFIFIVFNSGSGFAESFENRNYEIHIGNSAPSKAPAVFLLHGGKSDGPTLRRMIRFDRLADQYGLVAVYPSAPGKIWNDERGAELGSEAGRDDSAYLARLVRHLGSQGLIDPENTFFAGISNGGGMSLKMACEYPDLVSGIGIIATKLFRSLQCDNYRPIPTLFFHGTEDRISPHEGRQTGREGFGFKDKGKTFSSRETIEIWRQKNGCSNQAQEYEINENESDNSSVRLVEFKSCSAPLKYYEVISGGHTWPGAREPNKRFLKRLIGTTNQDISANQEMIKTWLGL